MNLFNKKNNFKIFYIDVFKSDVNS